MVKRWWVASRCFLARSSPSDGASWSWARSWIDFQDSWRLIAGGIIGANLLHAPGALRLRGVTDEKRTARCSCMGRLQIGEGRYIDLPAAHGGLLDLLQPDLHDAAGVHPRLRPTPADLVAAFSGVGQNGRRVLEQLLASITERSGTRRFLDEGQRQTRVHMIEPQRASGIILFQVAYLLASRATYRPFTTIISGVAHHGRKRSLPT